jgi:hypothetical protein
MKRRKPWSSELCRTYVLFFLETGNVLDATVARIQR